MLLAFVPIFSLFLASSALAASVERRSFAVRTQPAVIQLAVDQENPWFEVTLTEGRNRQIRRMFEEGARLSLVAAADPVERFRRHAQSRAHRQGAFFETTRLWSARLRPDRLTPGRFPHDPRHKRRCVTPWARRRTLTLTPARPRSRIPPHPLPLADVDLPFALDESCGSDFLCRSP